MAVIPAMGAAGAAGALVSVLMPTEPFARALAGFIDA